MSIRMSLAYLLSSDFEEKDAVISDECELDALK